MIGAGHPDRLLRKGGARPGDALLLTKRLGTGVLVSGQPPGPDAETPTSPAAIDQMRRLNRAASEVLVAHGIAGATDVTGFGLLGHGLEMARASGTRFVFDAAALPALPGAIELAAAGVETGGAAHNRRFVAPALTVARRVAAGSRHPRPRPADVRWAARRGPGERLASVRSRARRRRRRALARRPGRGLADGQEPGVRLA